MGGGLMQSVAAALKISILQVIHKSLFSKLSRRHTNFSVESIEQTFSGTADFGKKVTCSIQKWWSYPQSIPSSNSSRGGHVGSDFDDVSFSWLNWIGHVLVKNVEIEDVVKNRQTLRWLVTSGMNWLNPLVIKSDTPVWSVMSKTYSTSIWWYSFKRR